MQKYFMVLCQMYDKEGCFLGSVDAGIKALIYPDISGIRKAILRDKPNALNVAVSQVVELTKEQFDVNFENKKEILEIL